MDDREERTDNHPGAVPGSSAHRVELRALLDRKDKGLKDQVPGYGLTEEQRDRVSAIIQEVMSEPRISYAQLIETLEGLLVDPDCGPGAIYMRLDDHRSIVTYWIAEKAFSEGLKAAVPEKDSDK